MKKLTLSGTGFGRYGKTTRQAAFLAKVEQMAPWADLCVLIEQVYPARDNGRPPVELERMLRIYFPRQWFGPSEGTSNDAAIIHTPFSTKMKLKLKPIPRLPV